MVLMIFIYFQAGDVVSVHFFLVCIIIFMTLYYNDFFYLIGQFKYASNTIQCLTEGQYEGLSQYLIGIFPDFNSEVRDYHVYQNLTMG